jgi:hypothetical protein
MDEKLDDDARRAHWETVFGEKAEGDVSWFQEKSRISLELIAKNRVGLAARVIDVGGGASRLVDGLLDEGYGALAVLDIAGAALERSKRRLGTRGEQVLWVVSDVAQWRPDQRFDVWHDRAVFHFMTQPDQRSAYLATLESALGISGEAIIATFASDGPERCSGLPVARYEPDALAVQLGPGFQLLESVREQHITPGGKAQSFQYSRFRRLS